MGVLAVPVEREHKGSSNLIVPVVCAAVIYAAVVASAAWHHEPWADEAQSWLLARDASLADLWTRLLHYEGTPGLWQTVLHVAMRLGLPYGGLNLLSAAWGLAACCLLLAYAPFPMAFRVTLPFTFYLCYQYSVVARSYCLAPALLFGAAALYPSGVRRIAALTGVLCLLAAISVHGMALSCSIWVAFHLELARRWRTLSPADRKRVMTAAALYVAALLLLILAAWPAADNMFVRRPYWSFAHLATVTGKGILGGFGGTWLLSLAAIGLSMPLLWRGRAIAFFAMALISLSLVNGIIYSQVWHYGLVFLGWLFALWVASARVRPGRTALAGLAIVICVQCYWTFQSIAYDWGGTYSASRDAAVYLKDSGIEHRRLFAIGYACTAIEPYFDRNIFANVRGGNLPAYWDWSNRNHVNEDSEKLSQLTPDYVIVGYKGDYEKQLWTKQIRQSGYQQVRHFEGNTFWQAAILEPESFDLYRRPVP